MYLQTNQRRLLSSLNPLFFIGAVLLLVLVRTAALEVLPSLVHHWDVLLPFVVFFGQRRTIPEGLILSLFSSHLYSLSSAAPIGVFTSVYLVIFLIARLLTHVIYSSTGPTVFIMMFFLGLLSRVLLYLVANAFGHTWEFFTWDNLNLLGLAFNGLLGWWVYVGLEWLDRLTFKTPPVKIEFSGGGL